MKSWMPLALAAALTGCGGRPPVDATPAPTPLVTAAQASIVGTRIPLGDYVWVLQDARDASGRRIDVLFPPEGEGRLVFDTARATVGGNFGCNSMGGPYVLHAGDILAPKADEGWMSTQIGCPQNAAERRLSELFHAPQRMRIVPGESAVLELARVDGGATTTWRGVPTWQRQYGQAGTRLLLQIDPQPVSCPAPASNPTLRGCLRVREVPETFTLWNGEKIDAPWFVIEGIRGYAHDPRIRQVVQVLRFDVDGRSDYVLEHIPMGSMVEEPR